MSRRCSKRPYRDEVAARLRLATLQRKDPQGHGEARAYRCNLCGRWHLTSQPMKTQPR